jgi:hypothetical protein
VPSRIGPGDRRDFLPDLPPLRCVQTGCPSAPVVLDCTPSDFWAFAPAAQKQCFVQQGWF